MITLILILIVYLVIGFIQTSLLHKYFDELESGFHFIVFTLCWPIMSVMTGLYAIGCQLHGYMEWLRKGSK